MKEYIEKLEILKEYMSHYIDLVFQPYFYRSDMPSFDKYLKYPEYRERFNRRELQHTFYVQGDKIITDFSAAIKEPPKGNWLYYQQYNSWHGFNFNIGPRILNPDFKHDPKINIQVIEVRKEPQKIKEVASELYKLRI